MPKYFLRATVKGSRDCFYKEFHANSGVDAVWKGLGKVSKNLWGAFVDRKTEKPLRFRLVIEEKQG